MPRISTINQPYGVSASSQPSQPKETLKNVPVFNHPGAYQSTGVQDTNLKVNNIKQVWGAQPDPATMKPGEVPSNVALNIQNRVQEQNKWQPKKKEDPKPVVDEKKEAMKNALFGGISTKKKNDDSSDDEPKKTEQPSEPASVTNLLDFDATPEQQPSSQQQEGGSGNLLDLIGFT